MTSAQRRWGPAEDEQLKKLHAEGLPANQIRKRMGWGLRTVRTHSQKLGLTYDRSMMKAAIEANKIDHKARRQKLAEKWLELLEEQTERVVGVGTGGKTFRTVVKQVGGAEVPASLDFLPPNDFRMVSQSLANMNKALIELEKVDSDGGMEEARGLVNGLLSLIRSSVQGEERLNPTAGVAK